MRIKLMLISVLSIISYYVYSQDGQNKGADSLKTSLPQSYAKLLDEALVLQYKADSVNRLIDKLKTDLSTAPADKKAAIKSNISNQTTIASGLQKKADSKYAEAQEYLSGGNSSDNKKVPPAKPKAASSTVKGEVTKNANTAAVEDKSGPSTDVYYYFEILKAPATDSKEKIKPNLPYPPGLIYRIQIAVFRNPVTYSYFKGISPIYGFRPDGKDVTVYYAGLFRRSEDARNALSKVKGKGFKDSFVTALMDGKQVSADRSAVLEKEWGNKPFESFIRNTDIASNDTIPPALTFRVEAARNLKPLKSDVVEGLKRTAGSRGLEIRKLEDGNTVYLIGNFITFESAAEFADLLVRNGYRESHVVAWIGNKEIPVETARKLIDGIN